MSPIAGCTLNDQALPAGASLAFIVRVEHTFVPDGATVFATDDVLLLVVEPDTTPETLAAWAS